MAGFGIIKSKAKRNKIPPHIKKMAKSLDLKWRGNEHSKVELWLLKSYEYAYYIESKLTAIYRQAKNEEFDNATNNAIVNLYFSWPGAYEITKWWAKHVNDIALLGKYWHGKLLSWCMSKDKDFAKMYLEKQFFEYSGDGKKFHNKYWPLIIQQKGEVECQAPTRLRRSRKT